MAKETSGLLMNVIGTLSSMQSNEQRDLERAKLEREFKLSDQRLENLVSKNHKDLANVMHIFTKSSSLISEARTRIAAVKGQLAACRGLLHCRRDELKKLWLEGVEHKQVLLMLEQIESLKDIPDEIHSNIMRKNYLAAAQLVVKAKENLQGPLMSVDALKEVRSNLETKQEHFYNILVEDLSQLIYVKSCSDVLQWRHNSTSHQAPFQRSASGRNSSGRASGNQMSGGKSEFIKAKAINLEVVTANPLAISEENKQGITNIMHWLSLLQRLPETLESLKANMSREMNAIATKTAHQISEVYPPGNASYLKELFSAVIQQLRQIVNAHTVVLDSLRAILDDQQNGHEIPLYSKEEVWGHVQAVIQLLLTQYLDVGNGAHGAGSSGSFPANGQMTLTDLNAHFAKKRQPRGTKSALFRFEGSAHAMALNASGDANQPHYVGVDVTEKGASMEPNARRIIEVYQPLMSFVAEIEAALVCAPGTHCALHTFVTNFTRDVFLSQIHVEMATSLEESTRKLDTWKELTTPETLQNLKTTRPLLQSTIQVQRCQNELRQLMEALPQFSQHFLGMASKMLCSYSETCQEAYRGLVQPEDKRVISATWAKDEDINRFLRTLPSWTALQTVRAQRTYGSAEAEPYEESPEEINQRSAKETEILTGNLGDAIIPAHEILADPMQLRILALLQESLEWFGSNIQEFASAVSRFGASDSSLALPDSSVQTLLEKAKDFEDLADTCLLVLHLEVRVHCFYHLVPLGRQAQFWLSNDNHEPDPEIGRLSRDLTSIDEALGAHLQPRKLRYIFEGVSHLVASIIIGSVQHIRRINENGVKKICRNVFSLQQTLTNITLAREPALDHARQYFELLCLTPEEILNGIMEQGAHYTELEYIQLLQLLNRSRHGTTNADVNHHLERLSEILGELGVTV